MCAQQKSIRCLTAFLMALAVLPMTGALAQDAAADGRAPQLQRRRLTVSGEGEVRRKPDKADIVIGVVTEKKTSQAAATANAEASSAIVTAIKRASVADRDIQTVTYAVDPIPTTEPGRYTITGYRVTNRLQITIRDIAHVGEILDATTGAGANTIDSIQFGIEEIKAAQDDALELAVLDARRKADRIARASGTTLVGIYEINEGGSQRPIMNSVSPFRAEAAVATPIQSGEATVHANVTIVFQIGPAIKAAARSMPDGKQIARRHASRSALVRRKPATPVRKLT